MPEGPEIRRAADRLEAVLVRQPLRQVWFAFPELKTYEVELCDAVVARIETRGKALLTHFSNGLTLYSHNQLYGVWRIVDAWEQPETQRVLRVRLETAEKAALLYSASDIELLNQETLAQHPFLLRVGPDVLDASLTVEQVFERLQSKRFCRRQFAGLLLDQAFLAGLGNYLRVEVLWHAQLLASHNASQLTEAQCLRLAQALIQVPQLSYHTRGTKQKGPRFRFEVFHREGKPCRRCGALIQRSTLASRPFYWCPGCQQ